MMAQMGGSVGLMDSGKVGCLLIDYYNSPFKVVGVLGESSICKEIWQHLPLRMKDNVIKSAGFRPSLQTLHKWKI